MKQSVKVYCESCDGKGLYQGFGEKDGCAVICTTCRGTGCDEIEYELFEKRRITRGIKRVFKSGCGYGHSANDYTDTKTGKVTEFSKAGCSYKEFLNGVEPKPVKTLYCPYLWTNQSLQTKDVNGLYKSRCKDLLVGGSISNCKNYPDKARCWEVFEGKK